MKEKMQLLQMFFNLVLYVRKNNFADNLVSKYGSLSIQKPSQSEMEFQVPVAKSKV